MGYTNTSSHIRTPAWARRSQDHAALHLTPDGYRLRPYLDSAAMCATADLFGVRSTATDPVISDIYRIARLAGWREPAQ